jgi:uncharacterized protein YydD (DUF2326 family)
MLRNNLNELQEEIVGLMQEEAAEIIQELSKVRRTGTEFLRNKGTIPTRHYLQKEIIDFMILLALAHETGIFGPDDFDSEAYTAQKLEKLKVWTNIPHRLLENT